jgi:hypothetical protein
MKTGVSSPGNKNWSQPRPQRPHTNALWGFLPSHWLFNTGNAPLLLTLLTLSIKTLPSFGSEVCPWSASIFQSSVSSLHKKSLVFFCFWDRVLLHSPGWPWPHTSHFPRSRLTDINYHTQLLSFENSLPFFRLTSCLPWLWWQSYRAPRVTEIVTQVLISPEELSELWTAPMSTSCFLKLCYSYARCYYGGSCVKYA